MTIAVRSSDITKVMGPISPNTIHHRNLPTGPAIAAYPRACPGQIITGSIHLPTPDETCGRGGGGMDVSDSYCPGLRVV
jgi:hypothetical protein